MAKEENIGDTVQDKRWITSLLLRTKYVPYVNCLCD